MPQQRMEIRMIKDILRLKYPGALSHERIARSLNISKGVVAKYLGLASAAGLDWQGAAELAEGALERRLVGHSAAETRGPLDGSTKPRRVGRQINLVELSRRRAAQMGSVSLRSGRAKRSSQSAGSRACSG